MYFINEILIALYLTKFKAGSDKMELLELVRYFFMLDGPFGLTLINCLK